jgi:hypothetical protein
MILSNSPKFFFEILAFFTVLFFILYQVEFTNNYNNTLAYTAIYIVAGYKIMPYLQAILFSFSNIKGSVESLNKIYLATKLKEEMSLINITNKIKKIQFQDFSYGYKNQNIFDMVKYVKANYQHFCELYRIDFKNFRNDYAAI